MRVLALALLAEAMLAAFLALLLLCSTGAAWRQLYWHVPGGCDCTRYELQASAGASGWQARGLYATTSLDPKLPHGRNAPAYDDSGWTSVTTSGLATNLRLRCLDFYDTPGPWSNLMATVPPGVYARDTALVGSQLTGSWQWVSVAGPSRGAAFKGACSDTLIRVITMDQWSQENAAKMCAIFGHWWRWGLRQGCW